MNDHFIRDIEIRNYKLFQDFKTEGFGRVNLIGGKNNAGKTAFMEAILLNAYSVEGTLDDFIKVLISIKVFRNYALVYQMHEANANEFMKLVLSFLKEIVHTSIHSKIANLDIKLNKDLEISFGGNKSYNGDDFDSIFINTEISLVNNFISSVFIGDHQLEDLYDGVKLSRKREKINEFINMFDRDLIEYDIIDNTPVCFSEKLNSFVSLDGYGNGVKRYIAYVCAIWANSNGHVFIDEIENGIHYTNLDKLWEVILTTAKQANVQVFATTHSKECIESYARVAKKLEDDEIAFVEMGINKYDKPRAIVMNSGRFYDELEIGNEVRGW